MHETKYTMSTRERVNLSVDRDLWNTLRELTDAHKGRDSKMSGIVEGLVRSYLSSSTPQ